MLRCIEEGLHRVLRYSPRALVSHFNIQGSQVMLFHWLLLTSRVIIGNNKQCVTAKNATEDQ